MTDYTVNQMATRVLKDLGLIAAEETPSSADLNWAIETIQSDVLLLNSKGIPIWNGSSVSVPQEYLTALSRRLGLGLASSFGLMDPASAIQAMRVAEDDLRIIGMIGASGTAQQADYF